MTQAFSADFSLPELDLPRIATRLADEIAETDRQLRRAGLTIPPDEVREDLARRFWSFSELATQVDAQGGVTGDVAARCRDILGRWLFRSRYWNRSYHKPHGYAGDFGIIEWIYDLEGDPCDDATQPGIVNCLDYLYATVPAVHAVWERRRWFAKLLHREQGRRHGALRVLDIAAGGGRYLRDFLADAADVCDVSMTVVDQDAAAIAFCRARSLAPWVSQVETRAESALRLGARLGDRTFDVVISSGLFDYLPAAVATRVLAELAARLAPGGILAFSNFHPSDGSRLIKDWLLDWPLIYREEDECARLLPGDLEIATSRSANGALCYATGRRR